MGRARSETHYVSAHLIDGFRFRSTHPTGLIHLTFLHRGPSTSYVDGPYWQALFDVSNELVCFGHMSGLLVRVYDRWP